MEKLCGVIAPIVTPCKPTGEVDVVGLSSVTKYLLDGGCDAIFVAGSTGRGPWFSMAEKAKACEAVAAQCATDVPVLAGCMGSSLVDMLDTASAMRDTGANAAVITAPYYFAYNNCELECMMLQFADKSPLPVLIYDIPAFAGNSVSAGVIERLALHENVVGFKDSSADLDRFRMLLNLLSIRKDFAILQGKEKLLSESLVAGASGFVVSLIHISPAPFVALYKSIRDGNAAKAQAAQKWIDELFEIVYDCLSKRPETSTLFHFLNEALRARGICDSIVLAHEGECLKWLRDAAVLALNHADKWDVICQHMDV